MKTNILLLSALFSGLCVPATATASGFVSGGQFKSHRIVSHAAKANTMEEQQPEDSYVASQRMKVTVAKAGENVPDYSVYGELIPVLEEDFSKFVTGSEGAPDMQTRIWNEWTADGDFIPWTNLKPEYTQRPNWGGQEVYCAGGIAYIDQTSDYAHINTPYDTDLSMNGGFCVLEFSLRPSGEDVFSGLIVEAAETNGMGPSWNVLGSSFTGDIPAGWSTVQCLFYGGGPSTMFNLVPYAQEALYIDNLKVYTLKQYVATPEVLPHSNYTGTGFQANWEAVEGADKYLVSVYTAESNGSSTYNEEYLVTDAETTTNSYQVTGATSGVTYYYTVKAVKGDHVSLPSLPVKVFDIVAPVMGQATVNADENKYTAEWSEVPGAERYNYMACAKRVAATDGEFVVFDEDFTGITNASGVEFDWSFDDPDPEAGVYDDLYPAKGLKQQGWHVKNGINYYNSICVDGFHYFYGGEDSGLISPELDLSKDGGKASLTLTLAGEFFSASLGYTDRDGNPVDLQVQAAVAVFNYDEKLRDYAQSELIYANNVNPAGVSPDEWRSFTFPITTGTSRSIIGIYAVSGPGNLYIDDMKLVQNYKAGESLYDPFYFAHWYDGNEIEVEVPDHAAGNDIYHKVSCTRSMSDGQQALYAESEYSALEFVFSSTSGLDNVLTDESPVVSVSRDGMLSTNGGNVKVYNVGGALVFSSEKAGDTTCVLPGRGVYLVNVDGRTSKVVF